MSAKTPQKIWEGLTDGQRRMVLHEGEYAADACSDAASHSRWHRTRTALLRRDLVEHRWPTHPAGGVVHRVVLTPLGRDVAEYGKTAQRTRARNPSRLTRKLEVR